ncbi:hypothetical protein AB0G15_36850 [Streptosporangium sp. NPDC023825]|uniref:hypothetical protein n=1 Tax=Streptosporangium sp. NPDC023825 TaxID=3154909 RepID=UPI003447EFB7
MTDDIEGAYEEARKLGYEIVHPMTTGFVRHVRRQMSRSSGAGKILPIPIFMSFGATPVGTAYPPPTGLSIHVW